MITAKFTSDEGEQQGAVERGSYFCIGIDPINRRTNDELGRHGGALFAGIDDTYMRRLPEHVFTIVHDHVACLPTIGLTLNLSKTKCYKGSQDLFMHELILLVSAERLASRKGREASFGNSRVHHARYWS